MTNPARNTVTIPVRLDTTEAAADLRALAGAFASAADMIDGDDPVDPTRVTVDRHALARLRDIVDSHAHGHNIIADRAIGAAKRLVDSADQQETA